MKVRQTTSDKRLREEQILKALEEVAERLSVCVHYEDMKAFEFRVRDGSCRLQGEAHVYIDRKRSTKERIHILAGELRRFDLDTIYIPPLLREKIFRTTPQPEVSPDAVETKIGPD